MTAIAKPDESAPPAPTARDQQRGALRQLVLLSETCAAREIVIESDHADALAAAAKADDKLRWEINNRRKTAIEEQTARHAELAAHLTQRFDHEAAVVRKADHTTRMRIKTDLDPAEAAARRQYDQDLWLADSVLETTPPAELKADQAKARSALSDRNEELDALRNQFISALNEYAFLPPAAIESEPHAGGYDAAKSDIERLLVELRNLSLPRLMSGIKPIVLGFFALAAAAAGSQFLAAGNFTQIAVKPVAIATGVALTVVVILGVIARIRANSTVRAKAAEVSRAMAAARAAAAAECDAAIAAAVAADGQALTTRERDAATARDRVSPILNNIRVAREQRTAAAEADLGQKTSRLATDREKRLLDADHKHKATLDDIEFRHQSEIAAADQRKSAALAAVARDHADAQAALASQWQSGLAQISGSVASSSAHPDAPLLPSSWADPAWESWKPADRFAPGIRFGQMTVDLPLITDKIPRTLALPPSFAVPAMLAFPRQASLLVESDRTLRTTAVATLQMVMTRLLTSLPPGRVRFTIIDPVGLGQNFAGFMHLADHDEALVTSRIWTSSEHIEQRLADLTEHMETVIQKYLRNEFATIDDYNAQAGPLAEPYRFLVINDFPTGFSPEALARLNSIAASGARCGVYTLIYRDTRTPMPGGSHIEDLHAHSIVITQQADRLVWKDEVFQRFPLSLDPAPPEDFLTPLMDKVGAGAKEAKRVEVPFETISPPAGQEWTGSATDELTVPIGRMGATRQQFLKLGRGVAQHALIAGKTGSGKSTLLHVIVTNIALWFSPDEVEMYLIDFKKGVEFKAYASSGLPHARAIAVESDREFGVSVLQRLDAELGRRGDLFRRVGVQSIAAFRNAIAANSPDAAAVAAADRVMPRVLLVIDEFQEFFSEDDKLAQEAGLLLDRLVRQGRAFGVHVLLGSQTIGGSSGLARSTIGQMAVRVALQTSEADSQLILGDSNSAARLLSRPGEAIYNDAGGLVEANSPFQISWLPDEDRDALLRSITARATAAGRSAGHAIVFEGNVPADIHKNRPLYQLLAGQKSGAPVKPAGAPVAYLGEPVAIKAPTGVGLRRQAGTNVLVIGQQEESALAVMSSMLVSLSASTPRGGARFILIDGTPADSPLAGRLSAVADALPHTIERIDYRNVAEVINGLTAEWQRRQETEAAGDNPVYVFIHGLQRYRILRRNEDAFGGSFSSSLSDEPAPPATDKQFADLIREGPPLGIHTIAWADTPATVDRTIDRRSLREFDSRVLFQMSATDSSNLIDSPAANKLGFHRALLFSEEQGVIEKFRPYAMPTAAWLAEIAAK